MNKVGLTLGKYAPFHKGHQYVIETALQEVDELYILIYDTKEILVPLNKRSNWIKELYPQTVVIECWDGPEGYSSEKSFQEIQEQYIIQKLNGKKVTHFYSSEFYGDHVSRALNAIDCRVDDHRLKYPISGTIIRSNPYAFRDYISDVVYKDLITKIVFVGAMSTGKTTIVKSLAKRYTTSYALEYGREYWEKNQINRRISINSFVEIAERHIELENIAIQKANRYCFIDTNAITTFMYALDYHHKVQEKLIALANNNYSRYDLFFLCDNDIPYDDTWDRSGDQKREVFQKQIIADLKARNIPYITISGNLESRISHVQEILNKFEKYSNFFGSTC